MTEVSQDYPMELEFGDSVDSLQKVLESQKALFHRQIDQLQNFVVTQCELTGVNPLSQEMAAGALSIKIGKRPRDLLNPKAVEYLHSVFSIKDAITKKESRDIAARFGMIVTQVKEFFNNQKSRVRKFVRLSRENTIKLSSDRDQTDEMLASSGPMMPIDPIPLNTISPSTSEDPSSCSTKEEVLDGIDESEKYFVDNIFSMMRKDESFAGQVKLMELILQMKNPSVLCWFLMKGGLMILATWLSQAAAEEQTSVLAMALKVLCHLPLNKALPVHVSAIIQGVNRLRFYRTSDISNRAKVLLFRWSKMFAKSQDLRKQNGVQSSMEADKMIDLKQRICELIGDESWQSTNDMSGDIFRPCGSADETRRLEPSQAVKLLTASADDPTKRQALGSTYKERRKVLLVEQPGQKTPSKSNQAPKAVPSTQARPITADEIQKAKLRAQFMQSKGNRIGSVSSNGDKMKSDGPKRPSSSLLTNDLLTASETYLHPKLDGLKKARIIPSKITKPAEASSDYNLSSQPNKAPEEGAERLRRVQIPWKTPPEVEMDASWNVATGQNSKEVEAQGNRIHREKEIVYKASQDIPPNPKDPWDIEMDYDDTLTPEIPVDQLPDSDTSPQEESQLTENPPMVITTPVISTTNSSALQPQAEPDLDLLAVLLKNPQLVYALTAGHNTGLSNVDTVKLLDRLKVNSESVGTLNGIVPNSVESKVEVSLPSPTPSTSRNIDIQVSLPSPTPSSRYDVSLPSPTPASNPAPCGWRREVAMKNPFSRHDSSVLETSTVATAIPLPSSNRLQQPTSMVQNHIIAPPNYMAQPALAEQLPHHSSSWPYSSSTIAPEKQTPVSNQIQPTTGYYHHRQQQRDYPHNNALVPQQPSRVPERQYPQDEPRTVMRARQGLTSGFHQHQHNQNFHEPPNAISGVRYDDNKQSMGWSGYRSLSPESIPNQYTDRGHGAEHGYGYRQSYPDREMNHGKGYSGQSGSFRQGAPGHQEHNSGYWRGGGQRRDDRRR